MADADFRPVFAALEGEWRLERQGSGGEDFAGTAVFRAAGADSLLLVEEGELRLPAGAPLKARREWLWRLSGEAQLEILFHPGGRTYHLIPLHPHAGGWAGEAVHPCGDDFYRAQYRFGADSFQIVHDVSGPAKDYRLTGRYDRAASA